MGLGLMAPLLRRIVKQGALSVVDPSGTAHQFGPGGAPSAGIALHGGWTPNRIALNPGLKLGEAFMDGSLTLTGDTDIRALLDVFCLNLGWTPDNPNFGLVTKSRGIQTRLSQINPLGRSRENVAHHYDLSDRLYDLFLDADRQYSCAYYTDADNSLEQAQADKKAHIAAKLMITTPETSVLDIGCGWGGLALYIHKVSGARVHGITLSEEQLKVAKARAEAAGVADKVTFSLTDYRELQGRYDRIVSVGMFEHVGTPHYREFFQSCHRLMADDGVMLLHTIGRVDGKGDTDPWTRKYIFPGGYAPALSEIVPHIEKSFFYITDIEVLRMHYAHTLAEWYKRTVDKREAIEKLYDARFFRMWTFYLAASEMAFRHLGAVNFQIQLSRRLHTLPLTRDYIAQTEQRYRAIAAG
jgi:cyclopropane-fatty-acyl-phospholipid synthase